MTERPSETITIVIEVTGNDGNRYDHQVSFTGGFLDMAAGSKEVMWDLVSRSRALVREAMVEGKAEPKPLRMDECWTCRGAREVDVFKQDRERAISRLPKASKIPCPDCAQ